MLSCKTNQTGHSEPATQTNIRFNRLSRTASDQDDEQAIIPKIPLMYSSYQDYLNAIMRYYHQLKDANRLPQCLQDPTPGKLKDECATHFGSRSKPGDIEVFRIFFESDKVDLRKIAKSREKFKPLINYLVGESDSTGDRNKEMLGWLIDYPYRPFDKYFDYDNTDPLITPIPGHKGPEPGSNCDNTPEGSSSDPEPLPPPVEPGKNKPGESEPGKWWKWAAILLFFLTGATFFVPSKEQPALANQEQVIKVAANTNEEQPLDSNAGLEVIICKTSTSYAYHAQSCIGLRQCGGTTQKLSLTAAKKAGRTPCGYCYPTRVDNPGIEYASQKLVQCEGMTKKKKRCSRMVKTGRYCWQHD